MEEEEKADVMEERWIHQAASELLSRLALQKDPSLCLASPLSAQNLQPAVLITDSEDLSERFTSFSPPTEFTIMALARRLSLDYHLYFPHLGLSPKPITAASDPLCETTLESENPSSPFVSLGLNCLASVLEALHETDLNICSQALASLTHLLSAVPLAGLAQDHPALAEKLLAALLTLSASSSEEISSTAGSATVSLVLASGSPEFFSRAALTFLQSVKVEESDYARERSEIGLPTCYTQLFLSQVALSIRLSKRSRLPSWSSISLQQSHSFTEFILSEPSTLSPDLDLTSPGAMASDGEYLYVLNWAGLFKVGTGFGLTKLGVQYGWNAEMKANFGTWLAFCNGALYLRREKSSRVWVLDTDTLRETGEILLPTATVSGKLCSDGTSFFLFRATDTGYLEAFTVRDNFSPESSPLFQLKLSKRTHESHGDDQVVGRTRNLEPWLAEACIEMQLSRKSALILTTSGEAYERSGVQDESQIWVKCPVSDPIGQISVSPEGHHSLILTSNGELWYSGMGLSPESHGAFPVATGQSIGLSRPRKVTAPNQKRIISCATSSSVLSIVTENGRVYSFGKNSSHTHPETGQVLHLDHVQIAAIDLGKTHAVALSKHGNVYTWGLNNLFQCGRTESLRTRTGSGMEVAGSETGSVPLCPPSEHIWLKDVATVCVSCGMCSAHGSRCSSRHTSPARGQTSPCGPGEAGCLRCGVCRRCGERSSPGSSTVKDSDLDSCDSGDRSQRLVLNPAKLVLPLPRECKISSIACGNYHSILLSADGKVISFGSNCHGQLGVGDTRRRVGPQSLELPGDPVVVQIAAGANHCVLRTSTGSVITFGSNKLGQLGRDGSTPHWNAKPGFVPLRIGEQAGCAEWVGAFGDSTVIRMEERLFAPSLDGVSFSGNSLNFSLFETGSDSRKRYAMINRKTNSLTSFRLIGEEMSLQCSSTWTLDPQYDVLWRYSTATKQVMGLSHWPLSGVRRATEPDTQLILIDYRLWLPWACAEPKLTPFQLGLSLMSALYTNTTLYSLQESEERSLDATTPSLESASSVSRFKSFGGGWGYSAQSVEAVQFQPSQNIEVIGFGLFGGRGEYSARVKLLRLIGDDYDEQNVELLAEVEETLFESLPREKAQICFLKPVLCYGGQTYLAWAQISGPSSDCGAGGQAVVSGDDGVVFKFRNSRLSNNGTDVHVGQIPSLQYRTARKSDEELNSPNSKILLPWPVESSAAFIKDLFSILNWSLRSMQSARSQSVEWLEEPSATLALMAIRLLRMHFSSKLNSSGNTSLVSHTKSALADAYTVGAELKDYASSIMEEIIRFEVEHFNSMHHSIESVQTRLTEILRNKDRSCWALIGLTESIALNGWGFPLLILSELSQNGDIRRPKRSHSSFPHFLRFFIEASLTRKNAPQNHRLEEASALLLGEIAKDLIYAGNSTPHLPVQCSPSRFQRLSSQPGWESGAGAPDALGFKVDSSGITVHGAAIYMGSNGGVIYTLEILVDQGDGFRESWHVLEKISGNLRLLDGGSRDNGFVCFHKPIKILPHVSYALRLHLQGAKTWSGEGGVNSIILTNGAKLSFVSTSLSINGTTVSRGQLPSILYSTSRENPYFKTARSKLAVQDTSRWFLLLLRSFADRLHDVLNLKEPPFSTKALSRLFGWTSVFLGLHPEKALDVLGTIDELLPIIASVNAHRKQEGIQSLEGEKLTYVAESQHPYKSGTVSSSVVRFDSNVTYMCLEFDQKSSTAQHEDWVSVYWSRAEKEEYYLLGRYGGIWGWPSKAVIVPGNSIWILLESASLHASVAEEKLYGYHCTITAFSPSTTDSLYRAERELVWLAAFAAAHLMTESKINKRDNLEETEIQDLIRQNGNILRKGLSLSHCPSIRELLADSFPTRKVPPELRFLNDFITASRNTAAGRLARWFWQKAFVDLEACDVCLSPGDPKCGESTTISLLLKDQFERPATAAGLEIKAITWLGKEPVVSPETDTLLSLFKESYQPTYLNKARYTAITMMPAYQEFSLEELRLAYFKDTVMKEVISLHLEEDGRFSGKWIPKQSGSYVLEVKIDGFRLPQSLTIMVGDGSRPLKATARHKVCQLSRVRTATVPEATITKAVRIRMAPSTTARQLGLIPRGSSVSYVDELDNKEGTWLRLSDESTMLYSQIQLPTQSWTLLRSKALDRHLLIRDSEVEECSVPGMAASIMVTAEEMYQVMDAEAAIRESPSTSQTPFCFLEIGAIVNSIAWLHNRDGVWVKIDSSAAKEHTDGREGFCLAQSSGGKVFLRKNTPLMPTLSREGDQATASSMFADNPSFSKTAKISNPKPTAHVWPRPSAKKGARCLPIVAASPSASDCIRSVFASLLWHEGLVHDAIACAAYLKFHPELTRPFPISTEESSPSVPSSLRMLAQLWEEIVMEININSLRTSTHRSSQMKRESSRGESAEAAETALQNCDLCNGWFSAQVATHMRLSHPGCGSHAGGRGYNSMGRYTTGWTGNCGDGGRGAATWYLLCAVCRRRYKSMRNRSCAAAMSEEARGVPPKEAAMKTIKKNAIFLLEVNAEMDIRADARDFGSGWTVNLFPSQNAGSSSLADSRSPSSTLAAIKSKSHASDPGPKLETWNFVKIDAVSSCGAEGATCGDVFMTSPSVGLKALVNPKGSRKLTIESTVINFVTKYQDLNRIKEVMRLSVRRSTALTHCFRVWTWLLRLVSGEECVMDILWHFLECLSEFGFKDEMNNPSGSQQSMRLLKHPLRLCIFAGSCSHKLLKHFHSFLYTIALILQSQNVNPALQRLCFQSWMFELTPHEQDLISGSHLLSCVGRIMSIQPTSHLSSLQDTMPIDQEELQDLTSDLVLETSSRPAMAVCLTDGSTETFWESGEEDRGRSKCIYVKFKAPDVCLISIYIDNYRDEGHSVSSLTVYSIKDTNFSKRVRLQRTAVGSEFCGWLTFWVQGQSHLALELRGPEPCLRVRQVCASGRSSRHQKLPKSPSLSLMEAVQADAFAVLRAVTAQAFSYELSEADTHRDLRQQVFDMLFSRNQLQSLRGYVCAQIVLALEKEVNLLSSGSKGNLSYCVGLLGMLTRISCAPDAINLLEGYSSTLPALSELLLFSGSPLQGQASETIARLASVTNPFSIDRKTFITNLLAVIAKSSTIQAKDKIRRTVHPMTIKSALSEPPQSWWLDQGCSPVIGRAVWTLLVSLASGSSGPAWRDAVREELAIHISYLQSTLAVDTDLLGWLDNRRIWLALAAMAVLREEDWLGRREELTSKSPVIYCENHEDGLTLASTRCQVCGSSLCSPCHSVLHLSKKNRTHPVQPLNVEAGRAKIQIHESTTRLRYAGFLILMDGAMLHGMIETVQNAVIAKTCRFCQGPTESGLEEVCAHPDCQGFLATACTKVHSCGHVCGGVKDEEKCLPCLKCKADDTLVQDAQDFCVICFTETLGGAPAIQFSSCGHCFHHHCARATLSKRWSGPRVFFAFMKCPICQKMMDHPSLKDLLDPLRVLFEEVSRKAQLRLEYDNLIASPAITDPSYPGGYYNNPEAFAMERYVYVLCSKCGQVYFGGEAVCQEALGSSQYDPAELLCGGCSDISGTEICPRHGSSFLEYKCRYCCSVAVFFCFGTTHFCTGCHDEFQKIVSIPKDRLPRCPAGPRGVELEGDECPLRVEHPPTGEEFALGCGVCRNLRTF